MDDALRIKLADLGSPEALAACIIQHFPDIQDQVPLHLIASAVGIVEIIGQRTTRFEGVLITNSAKSRGSIAYNEASSPKRRRFTIAHELGHFLIPVHGANAQCMKVDMGVLVAKDANRRREAEANRFAAALLMPREIFLRDIRKLGTPDVRHFVKLSDDYQVSKEAVVCRYMGLADDPCAVIFSQQGIASHIYRTANFPFITVRKNQPLPRQCNSMTPIHEPGTLSECSEIEPALWLDDTRAFHNSSLYEQHLDQADGRRLTLLSVEGELDDAGYPNEEEELEDSWKPKFAR